jgi:hypothetical protein
MEYKIWDNKFNHYCFIVNSKQLAEIMVEHFIEADFTFGESMKNRYRIDEVNC